MSQLSGQDIVFFFGAGASAPFGIPTMTQFVTDFERLLSEEGTDNERQMYTRIKSNLENRLKRQVDLEAIFTVIDGIVSFSPEKLGLLSTYLSSQIEDVADDDKAIGKSLRLKFQNFVKEKCVIPQDSFENISAVYSDFFNRFALEFPDNSTIMGEYAWNRAWKIFTTNYDTCLEHYWHVKAKVEIDTGFDFNRARNANILLPQKFLADIGGIQLGIQLLKLHGSVNWLIEEGTGDVIETEMTTGTSHVGRRYIGEMMIYPIAEKELYFDPYISMLLSLNRELQRKLIWVVIGYSFNDPVVREIFIRKSNPTKHLILVHPRAKTLCEDRLNGFKGKTSHISKKFGLKESDNFRQVNHQIILSLKKSPRYSWEETPRFRP